ncbi:MAG: phosphohydrolase [Deltaproteobacteria bacterium RIFOXYD12_FULL_57_12]|nr:MAG: phosphohydrolase [Deltaproteobacteria bacterium RIFOXYD12_FULL_57_12]
MDNYLKLIKRNYSFINVGELLSYAGVESYQVEDEGHWFTQQQVNLFHKRLQELTGNKNIAREAGMYSVSPDALGMMRRYILGLIGPHHAYELLEKYANKFTRATSFKARTVGRNKVEILVTPNEGVREEPFQCENRSGYFEAISRIFNYKISRIEHSECMAKGDKVCRYVITWQESRSVFWLKVRNVSAVLLTVNCIAAPYVFSHFIALSVVLPLSLAIVVLLSWHSAALDNRELRAAVENLKGASDNLIEQINVNYDNALMVNEIGQALSKEMDIDGLLARVTEVLRKRLDYDRGLVLLANGDKTRLTPRAGFGYSSEQFRILQKTGFHLDRRDARGMFVVSFKEQRPLLLNDINEMKDDLSARSLDFAKKMGVKSFICCPIVYENESLGVLAVDNIVTKRPLIQRDINLLMGVAPQIGISIHKVWLLESKLRQFRSILQALAATTDARDPITAGHSEKVAEYAVGISRELGMSKDYCEMIRVASLLHDYGKIGVDDSILKKPGKLTDEEQEAIKTHVVKTRAILEQIDFEGLYREVPEIAGAHHEKLDGSGYPDGLRGEQIPMGARIIAVADVFEAITSKRHYRDPMSVDVAFEFLYRKADIHLDRSCISAFASYYYSTSRLNGQEGFVEKRYD